MGKPVAFMGPCLAIFKLFCPLGLFPLRSVAEIHSHSLTEIYKFLYERQEKLHWLHRLKINYPLKVLSESLLAFIPYHSVHYIVFRTFLPLQFSITLMIVNQGCGYYVFNPTYKWKTKQSRHSCIWLSDFCHLLSIVFDFPPIWECVCCSWPPLPATLPITGPYVEDACGLRQAVFCEVGPLPSLLQIGCWWVPIDTNNSGWCQARQCSGSKSAPS